MSNVSTGPLPRRSPGGARSGWSCGGRSRRRGSARKSCSPTSAAAARRTASVSIAWRTCHAVRAPPRRAHEVVPDRVAVDLAARREARVEVGRRLGDVDDREVGRQDRVQPAQQAVRRDVGLEVEARRPGRRRGRRRRCGRRRARTPSRRSSRGSRPPASPAPCAGPPAAASPRSRCRRTRRRCAACGSKLEHEPERPVGVAEVHAGSRCRAPRCRRSVYWNTSDVWFTPRSASKERAASGSKKSSTSASRPPRASPGCRRGRGRPVPSVAISSLPSVICQYA